MRKYGLAALLVLLPPFLFGARLTLRDGTVIYGNFISGTPQNLIFQDDNGVRRRFDLNQVQGIDFGRVTAQAAPYHEGYNSADRTGEPNGANPAVVPAGSPIAVRTDQDINADNAFEGQTFPATIVRDVVDENGNVVIPGGSPATLVVRSFREGDTLRGPSYVLDLQSVEANGRRYMVSTTDITAGQQGIGKNRRTAEYVGGGAVLGTLLGAIAGGGTGAAIGAVGGAVAGGGLQVLTRGRHIRVPAETVLNFRLDQPLRLHEVAY